MYRFELMFRASEHNFDSSKFHELCSKKAPNIVIMKTEFDKIVGGYSTIKWKGTAGYRDDNESKCFLFSITDNVKLPQKMPN